MTKSYYSTYSNKLEVLEHTTCGEFPVDFSLLFDIMYQQSPTYQPAMEAVKKDWLIELISKIDGVTVTESKGNIYCTKGESEFYPTIVAHYDTAQDYHQGMRIFKTDKWIFGFDDATGEQCGLGLDDSVGVCFAIQMLQMMPVCKVFLPFGEERGLVGTYCCDMSFFDNSLVVTQLDRRSYTNDFIKFTNGLQTFNPEHYSLIEPLMKKYDYTFNSGTATDIGGLRKQGLKVSSHNLACGYFNEHTNTEVASVALVINAFSFAYEMLTMLAERNIPLTFPVPVVSELPYGGSKKLNTVRSSEKTLSTEAKQVNMWDDVEDWYFDARQGGWVMTATEKKAEVLDVFEEEDDIDFEIYSEYMMQCYPEYTIDKEREKLKSISTVYDLIDLTQREVDECLVEQCCPFCLGENVTVTNDLLLSSYCTDCSSLINIPECEQPFYETKMDECFKGLIDFNELIKL